MTKFNREYTTLSLHDNGLIMISYVPLLAPLWIRYRHNDLVLHTGGIFFLHTHRRYATLIARPVLFCPAVLERRVLRTSGRDRSQFLCRNAMSSCASRRVQTRIPFIFSISYDRFLHLLHAFLMSIWTILCRTQGRIRLYCFIQSKS